MSLEGVLVLTLLASGGPSLGDVAGDVQVVGVSLGSGEVAEGHGAGVLLGNGLRRFGLVGEVLRRQVLAQAPSSATHHPTLTALEPLDNAAAVMPNTKIVKVLFPPLLSGKSWPNTTY